VVETPMFGVEISISTLSLIVPEVGIYGLDGQISILFGESHCLLDIVIKL